MPQIRHSSQISMIDSLLRIPNSYFHDGMQVTTSTTDRADRQAMIDEVYANATLFRSVQKKSQVDR